MNNMNFKDVARKWGLALKTVYVWADRLTPPNLVRVRVNYTTWEWRKKDETMDEIKASNMVTNA